jgi:imidazolonepropionase
MRAKLVTPGLIDCHTHSVFSGNRSSEWARRLQGESYQEICRSGGGILSTVRRTRQDSELDLLELAKKRVEIFLRHGVTTLEVKSGYGLTVDAELKILKVIDRLRGESSISIEATFMGAHSVPPEFSSAADYSRYIISRILPAVSQLARFQDIFCEKGYFSKREGLAILEAGKRRGLIPKVHAHEFGRSGGVDLACQVGAASADHLMYVNASDIQKLKKAKVVPVVLPGTSFFLGAKQFAPVKKMLEAGLPVAIGSDFNPGTNPGMSFLLCGTFACTFYGLEPETVLTMQTMNSAKALRLKDRGMLVPGYRADIVCWDHDSLEEIYYSYGQSRVVSVVIGEKIIRF